MATNCGRQDEVSMVSSCIFGEASLRLCDTRLVSIIGALGDMLGVPWFKSYNL
ncbi:hypothetical protein HanIR_Chr11g0546631 [Helianthus annuus]|nr:hypothetical protein HanIR_Chr11g0546631 [Helianthus annuus]